MVDVDDLSPAAVDRYMKLICQELNAMGDIDKAHFLSLLTTELDMLDQDDAFGTEGWEHRFGVK